MVVIEGEPSLPRPPRPMRLASVETGVSCQTYLPQKCTANCHFRNFAEKTQPAEVVVIRTLPHVTNLSALHQHHRLQPGERPIS